MLKHWIARLSLSIAAIAFGNCWAASDCNVSYEGTCENCVSDISYHPRLDRFADYETSIIRERSVDFDLLTMSEPYYSSYYSYHYPTTYRYSYSTTFAQPPFEPERVA